MINCICICPVLHFVHHTLNYFLTVTTTTTVHAETKQHLAMLAHRETSGCHETQSANLGKM